MASRMSSGVELLRALQHVDRDFEIGVLEADRLGPLLAGRGRVGVAELLRGLSGQARLERMVLRPPHLGRGAGAAVAQRFDRRGKQQRFGRRHDLGAVALLRALGPEGDELRRVEDAAGDLAIGRLELGDLRGEVFAQRRIEAEIDDVEALAFEGRRHAVLLVVGGDPVLIVGEHEPDLLVGRHRQPHVGEQIGDHAEAPEEVVGPLEAFGRIAFASEEEVFPGIIRGDAGNAGKLALIRDRDDGVAGRRGDHDVDLVVIDELRGDFRRAVGVRLAVAIDDLDRVLLAGDGDPGGEHLAHLAQHPLVGLAERGDRAGRRAHHADFDRAAGGARGCEQPGRGQRAERAGADSLDDLAAR